ncbi:MAG: fibronectin type III domain-containing protein [Thermoplasmata archaeon]|nr:MAG: fibronectin type III domain-containing protein [Thermoplasmata archaeon]
MSPVACTFKMVAFAFTMALVVIFLRGDLVMDVQGQVDEPPVADAGPDQEVHGPVHVEFDGTGSTDDIEVMDLEWELVYEGETVSLQGPLAEFFFEVHGEYSVTLTVTDGSGQTDTDEMVVTVKTVPGVIERVTVIGRNNWNDIAWSRPVHDGGSPVVGCIVYRGTSPDDLEPYYSDWIIRYWSWDPLAENGRTYYYAVAAINEVGMGPLSEVASGMPMAVPDSPQNLTLDIVDGTVSLEWDPPLWSEGRVEVIGYQVHKGTDPDWLYETIDVGMNTSFVDEEVEDGTTYYYVVGALSSLGGSSVSELMNVTVGGEDVDDDERQPEWYELVLSFLLIIGLAGLAYFVLRMERNIGKKE